MRRRQDSGRYVQNFQRERRGLFWFWVAASTIIGAYIGLATPAVHSLGLAPAIVAIAVPVLNILLLLTAGLWLIRVVMGPMEKERRQS